MTAIDDNNPAWFLHWQTLQALVNPNSFIKAESIKLEAVLTTEEVLITAQH